MSLLRRTSSLWPAREIERIQAMRYVRQAGECVLCLNLSSRNDLFLDLSDLTFEWVHDKDMEVTVRLLLRWTLMFIEVEYLVNLTWIYSSSYAVQMWSLSHTYMYIYMYSLSLYPFDPLCIFVQAITVGSLQFPRSLITPLVFILHESKPPENLTRSCRLLSELGEWARERL